VVFDRWVWERWCIDGLTHFVVDMCTTTLFDGKALDEACKNKAIYLFNLS
jgi:hypothetical protein